MNSQSSRNLGASDQPLSKPDEGNVVVRDELVDVLVVDDDRDVRGSCADILRAYGFKVEEAEDGSIAFKILKSTRVGVLLLDWAMPVIDGLALLDMLDDPPPVVLMTARDYSSEVMERRSKVFMFVQKPVPPQYLVDTVARAITSRS